MSPLGNIGDVPSLLSAHYLFVREDGLTAISRPACKRPTLSRRKFGHSLAKFIQRRIDGDLHRLALLIWDSAFIARLEGYSNRALIIDVDGCNWVSGDFYTVVVLRIVGNPVTLRNITKLFQRLSQRIRINKCSLVGNAILLDALRGSVAIIPVFVGEIQVDVIWNLIGLVSFHPLGYKGEVIDAIFVPLGIVDNVIVDRERNTVLVHGATRITLELPALEYKSIPFGHGASIIAYGKGVINRPSLSLCLSVIALALIFCAVRMLE